MIFADRITGEVRLLRDFDAANPHRAVLGVLTPLDGGDVSFVTYQQGSNTVYESMTFHSMAYARERLWCVGWYENDGDEPRPPACECAVCGRRKRGPL